LDAQQHAALDGWSTVDDCLLVGGTPITELCDRVGGTPFYAYDRQRLNARIALLRSRLPSGIKLHYAIKANPMSALVCHVAGRVDGLDVASAGELKLALDAGTNPRDISFAGPGKRESELAQALAANILLNIESRREVIVLAELCARTGRNARVAVRVNPDFELKASGMRMSGGSKQFGVDAEAVPELLDEIARAGLAFEGFHIYSGSQNLSAEAICEAQLKTIELAFKLALRAPAPVRSINIGGGFGIPYFPGERALALEPIGANLHAIVDRTRKELPEAHLIVELGRYISGEAGIYVCKVLDRKISRGEVFLVTDGGMHHHLAASGNFGQVLRKNYPVIIGNKVRGARREIASVVGPLCTPLDLLAHRVELAEAQPGDLVVVFQSGAYGATASPVRFLSHPDVTEHLV